MNANHHTGRYGWANSPLRSRLLSTVQERIHSAAPETPQDYAALVSQTEPADLDHLMHVANCVRAHDLGVLTFEQCVWAIVQGRQS